MCTALHYLALTILLSSPDGPTPLDVPESPPAGWWADPCRDYQQHAAEIGRKRSNVVVVNYNPVIESEGRRKLSEVWKWNNPVALTRDVIEAIRTASGGYVNYEIVKWIDVDGCPPWRSGFRYDDAGIMDVLRTQQWAQGDGTSYRRVFEENGITREYVEHHNISEVWLWGAPGFHWDEYAMFIPDRERRLPPTENPWFYRPYDIPDLGRTMWVMGWNYERGLDCALESYAHRCEGILALVLGNGTWDKRRAGLDPWNTFSMCDIDFPGSGGCGNVHVPPNGQHDYDYANLRSVESYCEDWPAWPTRTGKRATIDGTQWNRDHAQYLTWWMSHFPKNPGRTPWGWNNWWIYIANLDMRLDAFSPIEGTSIRPEATYFVTDEKGGREESVTLQQAMERKLVDVTVTSLGGPTGNTIRVAVRRKVPRTLHIEVQPGTVFKSTKGDVQNMTAGALKGKFVDARKYRRVDDNLIVLADDQSHAYLVEAYCLDFHKPAPRASDAFELSIRVDPRAMRLFLVSGETTVSVEAYQAALWMDRAGASPTELKQRFPRITDADVRVARQLLARAEQQGKAEIPSNLPAEVRVEVEKLFASNPTVRVEAAKNLWRMGPRSAGAAPFLAANLLDENLSALPADVRVWVQGLGTTVDVIVGRPDIAAELLSGDSEAVARLLPLINSPRVLVRRNAARALGLTRHPHAIEPLIQLLDDSDARTRAVAAEALGRATGQDFGQDRQRWAEWWQTHQAEYLSDSQDDAQDR